MTINAITNHNSLIFMPKISAFIIAKNEASRISKAINSLNKVANEVIVIDSGSEDETVSIAKKLGAKVFFNKWPGYVAQKSYGEQLCTHEWVLNIDADEELTPKLQAEIKQIFKSKAPNIYEAFYIKILILHRNDKKARFLAPYNKVIRLYNRKFCSFANTKNSTTHDAVTFNHVRDNTKIYNLRHPAYHRSGTSIEQLVNKANFYSTEQAQDMVSIGRSPSFLRIIFEFPICFLKAFFIRRYFVFGFNGFIDSTIFAFARFMRFAKARELINYRHEKNRTTQEK